MDHNQQQYQAMQAPTHFTARPTPMNCPYCKKMITTSVKHEPGTGSYVCGAIICLLGGWAGCCLIPCCVKDCQDAQHTCPSCGREVGKKGFMFGN